MLTYKRRNPVSGDVQPPPITVTYKRRKPATTIDALPTDLVVDILARLPGKQIGRCKCVCKPWGSMICSSPFRDTYRRKNSGLLLYSKVLTDISFFYCPLRRHNEPRGEFDLVGEVDVSQNKGIFNLDSEVTNLVHGLICSFERKDWTTLQWLTLHNICTGEKMRIPKPLKYARTYSDYYLGYGSAMRVYKLLRITYHFIFNEFSNRSIHGVEIITLNLRFGPRSTWRKLPVSGLPVGLEYASLEEIRGDDNLLCWENRSGNSLVLFDFDTEIFQTVSIPFELKVGMHFQAVTRSGDYLAFWLSSRSHSQSVANEITCYVQKKDGGKEWKISKEFKAPSEVFEFAVGMFQSSFSNGEILGMYIDGHINGHVGVHVYSPEENEENGVFIAGELPNARHAKLFCFANANHLYLPLNDVLGGGSM